MISGLKEGQEKMSKTIPDSAIFMDDSPNDVKIKIENAYCPLPEENKNNPCLEYMKYIVFESYPTPIELEGKM